MARTVRIHLTDDLDGSPAAETVRFSVDGVDYAIDLNDVHAEDLRQAIKVYIGAGRKAPRGVPTATRTTGAGGAGGHDRNQSIRAWARRAGVAVSDRGRIPADVIARFERDTRR
jgi:hypothetical protein